MNNNFDIPLYRGKKVDNTGFVVGFLYSPTPTTFYILTTRSGSLGLDNEIIIEQNEYFEIDPSTLAISTKREDKKTVFEAINTHGKGGDIVIVKAINSIEDKYRVTEKRVAILNTDWNKFYESEWVNEAEIIEIKGIQLT